MRIAILALAALLFTTPAFAGKDKTDEAWSAAYKKVLGAVAKPEVESAVSKMRDEMDSG